MPRQPRLELQGIPLHVTQRGVNKCAIFLDDEDRRHFYGLLLDSMAKHSIAVHAWVFMDNHFHLLLTPLHTGTLSLAMRRMGQCYVQAFNRRHKRSGTLWQGRFKSCLVDSEQYLLAVYRYIELNPVRAAMVERPEQYRWSSIHANLNRHHDALVTPHLVFTALASDAATRRQIYSEWMQQAVSDEDLQRIRRHIQQERALGSKTFQGMMEKALGRPVVARPRGRPPKAGDKAEG